MARIAMSPQGRTEGYLLLDAVIAILLSVVVGASILQGIGAATRRAQAILERSRALVAAWNGSVLEHLDDLAP
jgi:hypothetical protein